MQKTTPEDLKAMIIQAFKQGENELLELHNIRLALITPGLSKNYEQVLDYIFYSSHKPFLKSDFFNQIMNKVAEDKEFVGLVSMLSLSLNEVRYILASFNSFQSSQVLF